MGVLTLICREHPGGIVLKVSKGKYSVDYIKLSEGRRIRIWFMGEEDINLFNQQDAGKFKQNVYHSDTVAVSKVYMDTLCNYIDHFLWLCSVGLIKGSVKLDLLNLKNKLPW